MGRIDTLKNWLLNEWFSERTTDLIIWICFERTANSGLQKKDVYHEIWSEGSETMNVGTDDLSLHRSGWK